MVTACVVFPQTLAIAAADLGEPRAVNVSRATFYGTNQRAEVLAPVVTVGGSEALTPQCHRAGYVSPAGGAVEIELPDDLFVFFAACSILRLEKAGAAEINSVRP